MLARVGGREGVFAAGGAALGDNAVVVVEGFVDGDVDALGTRVLVEVDRISGG